MLAVQGPRARGGRRCSHDPSGGTERDHPRAARQGARPGVSPLLGHGDYGVTTWAELPEWSGPIDSTDQVLCVASTGGAKSTLLATITLDVSSLVVIDDKGAMALPRA